MGEFSNRVEAQRQILKVINGRRWSGEQLFAVSTKAIQRWALSNGIENSAPLVKFLNSASAQIFVMANHSDDPIAGSYVLSKQRVVAISEQLKAELANLK